jgi:hypothetical protein
MDSKTGLSEVCDVTSQVELAKYYMQRDLLNRIEEWIVDGSNKMGKLNEFYSIEDFEERK